MIAALIASILAALVAGIAKKAGMGGTSRFFFWIAMLAFIGWLASGPGFAIVNWIQNPSVDLPSVDVER